MKVGLVGFGKAGRAVASILLLSKETKTSTRFAPPLLRSLLHSFKVAPVVKISS